MIFSGVMEGYYLKNISAHCLDFGCLLCPEVVLLMQVHRVHYRSKMS